MMWSTIIIISNVLLHLMLDSLASKVLWFYPISDSGVGLFHVPSQHEWWVWNYLFHWTFGFEILIVVAAGCLLYYKRNQEASCRTQKEKHYAGNRFNRGG
jgi:inner membrane protein